jgi:protein gp37
LHYRRGGPFNVQTMAQLEPFLDEVDLRKILTAKTCGKLPVSGGKCFPFDMTDLFGDWVPNALIDRVLAVFAWRADVTFQIVTKRAKRMHAYFTEPDARGAKWHDRVVHQFLQMQATGMADLSKDEAIQRLQRVAFECLVSGDRESRHLPNVWLLVSAERQIEADARVPWLLRTPALLRGVSVEPMLAPVDLDRFTCGQCSTSHPVGASLKAMKSKCPTCEHCDEHTGPENLYWLGGSPSPLARTRGLDWVIVGGESGHGQKIRPCAVEWVDALARQVLAAETALFIKQLGSRAIIKDGRQFRSFEHWVNKAQSWLGGVSGGGLRHKKPDDAFCIDQRGRMLRVGLDFMRARDEGAFPVDIYRRLRFADRKGGDPQEWPAALAAVRQFPEAA